MQLIKLTQQMQISQQKTDKCNFSRQKLSTCMYRSLFKRSANKRQRVYCIPLSNEGEKLQKSEITASMILCRINNFPLRPFWGRNIFCHQPCSWRLNGRFLSEEEGKGGNLELLISHSPRLQRVNRAVEFALSKDGPYFASKSKLLGPSCSDCT